MAKRKKAPSYGWAVWNDRQKAFFDWLLEKLETGTDPELLLHEVERASGRDVRRRAYPLPKPERPKFYPNDVVRVMETYRLRTHTGISFVEAQDLGRVMFVDRTYAWVVFDRHQGMAWRIRRTFLAKRAPRIDLSSGNYLVPPMFEEDENCRREDTV